jgi:Protein of unknown function (DUF1236)
MAGDTRIDAVRASTRMSKTLFVSLLALLALTIVPRVPLADDKGNEDIGKQAEQPKPPQTGAFVNGALAVPGAPANTETVPAKFSQQNAADDKLPPWGYTFKHLSPEQRAAIYQSIARQNGGSPKQGLNTPGDPVLGEVLPDSVPLRAPPADMVSQIPEIEKYLSAMVGDKAVLVEPASRSVVAVLTQ